MDLNSLIMGLKAWDKGVAGAEQREIAQDEKDQVAKTLIEAAREAPHKDKDGKTLPLLHMISLPYRREELSLNKEDKELLEKFCGQYDLDYNVLTYRYRIKVVAAALKVLNRHLPIISGQSKGDQDKSRPKAKEALTDLWGLYATYVAWSLRLTPKGTENREESAEQAARELFTKLIRNQCAVRKELDNNLYDEVTSRVFAMEVAEVRPMTAEEEEEESWGNRLMDFLSPLSPHEEFEVAKDARSGVEEVSGYLDDTRNSAWYVRADGDPNGKVLIWETFCRHARKVLTAPFRPFLWGWRWIKIGFNAMFDSDKQESESKEEKVAKVTATATA